MSNPNGNNHPLLDFCHKIAYDPHALCAFLDGTKLSPSPALDEALHSGIFKNVQDVLSGESTNLIKVQVQVDDLRLDDGSTNAGWVLSTLMDQINGGWTPPPSTPTLETSQTSPKTP
jgi:hypothetical protein